MDSVTQACLGAALGAATLPRLGRRALLLGAALGTLPDLDVLIDYGDAVANFSRHRGFSHSLFVLTGVATLFAWGASRWPRTREIAGFGHWWWLFALCLLTHPIIDAFTTYGTQLWWPIPMTPVAWDNLSIIDPLFTLPMLVGVILFAWQPRHHRWLCGLFGLSCLYVVFSFGAKAYVESRLTSALAERGLGDAPVLVQPAPLTMLLWRVTVIDDGQALEGWVGLFDGDSSIDLTPWPLGERWREAALQTADGQRLAWFCGPFLSYDVRSSAEGDILEVTDIRLLVPGAHPFTFAIARRDAGGHWEAITATQEPAPRPTRAVMKRLMQRIIDPQVVPVPGPGA
ncbi:metal-dependent hydrolase [Salinicola avicenniae]|uniref:metal-dependent hydrolase n=1 Tax=Salinicola avicenniae TaxID=2916836 RepID=UPI0020736E7C|nr:MULTISPECIES: metal-dependent hydrolase [unclassified Salinicola]